MEVWVTEYQCVTDGVADKPWAVSEAFTSRRIAEATAADANDSQLEDAKRNWKFHYRVRRYVPEPPPIPQGEIV